jgi:uncharacterized NAD(P)/FAD-binding protein YdhS
MAMQTVNDAPRVAIIGMGSRGLSVLEQLIGLARHSPTQALHIELFDPQAPGSGLHLPEQPDYLMLNTMAGQISAFSTAFPASGADEPPGPDFLQWCHAHALQLDERGHVSSQGQGRPVAFGDFVPRKLLGRYLQDSYRYLLDRCPTHIQVRHHRQSIVGCRPLVASPGFVLRTDNGQQIAVDGIFLSTGHARQTPEPCIGRRVAIEGLGLSAMDQLAALTQGLAGRFVRDASPGGWRYERSGHEPQIYLFSRSGLPFHARPQWQPGQDKPRKRWFFSAEAIVALRAQSPDGQLDFRQHVLPLIEDEMRAVFYQAKARLETPCQLADVQQQLQQATDAQARREVLTALAQRFDEFDPQPYLVTRRWQGDPQHYATWYRQWIEMDLLLSRQGLGDSPLKQALEVWRDDRELLRLAVDHNGLTHASTLEFYAMWAGLSNRLVGGPQKERYEDLLALIDAGVVRVLPPMQVSDQGEGLTLTAFEGSPLSISIDTLIRARNAPVGLGAERSPLIDDLLGQGLLRAAHAFPADGIDVDEQSRAVRGDGSLHGRLWVLGPGVEGSTFYNHYVPTPDPACRAPLQARRAVQDCLTALQRQDDTLVELSATG